MALLHIPLAQIDEARLQALIAVGAAESRTIDYKRATYGNADADYSEFLADTSSFANTSGGDLVLGMAATNGIPTAITSLSTPMDREILRLEYSKHRFPSRADPSRRQCPHHPHAAQLQRTTSRHPPRR